jgi:hypothetical protein
MQPQDVVVFSSHEEKNAWIDAWIARAQAKTYTPDQLEAEHAWLLEQPTEKSEPGSGLADARERYLQLEAIPEDERTQGKAWELQDLKPLAVLATYPRFLELQAITAAKSRSRTREENAELRALEAPLKQEWRMGQSDFASPQLTAMTVSQPAARVAQRPREHRAGSCSRARAPSSDDGPEPELELPLRLDAELRLGLRRLIHFARLKLVASMRDCRGCDRWLPVDEFRPTRATCRDCEGEAQQERRHGEAIAA